MIKANFWKLKDGRIVYCLEKNEATDQIEIIDINDPSLKKESTRMSLLSEEFSFNVNHPTRSQILYRKNFYKTNIIETKKILDMLRRSVDF